MSCQQWEMHDLFISIFAFCTIKGSSAKYWNNKKVLAVYHFHLPECLIMHFYTPFIDKYVIFSQNKEWHWVNIGSNDPYDGSSTSQRKAILQTISFIMIFRVGWSPVKGFTVYVIKFWNVFFWYDTRIYGCVIQRQYLTQDLTSRDFTKLKIQIQTLFDEIIL